MVSANQVKVRQKQVSLCGWWARTAIAGNGADMLVDKKISLFID
jgi:hypothetical protein